MQNQSGYFSDPAVLETVKKISASVSPSPAEAYPIHKDGGMIYNPISKEKKDSLHKYDNAEMFSGSLRIDGAELSYRIPKAATAYDAVPVFYTLHADDSETPIHIEACASEAAAIAKDQKFFDNTLPAFIDVDFEYLGYMTAKADISSRPKLSYTFGEDRKGKRYPCYDRSELIRSSTVPISDYVWFKIGYKNTGNTILDGNGGGTFCFEPILYQKNAEGGYDRRYNVENLFYRLDEELYPGQSDEMWITFCPNGLREGDYRILINCLVRNETDHPEHYEKNIWHGERYSVSVCDFKVTKEGGMTEPNRFEKIRRKEGITRNRWLHTYEEFMTSFDSWLHPESVQEGILYVQPAPWTDQIVLKLLKGDENVIDAAYLPVRIESDSIRVRFNPDNGIWRVQKDGTRYPVIQAQSMADMRGNIQQSPYPEDFIVSTFKTMKDIGINVINTTAAFQVDDTEGTGQNNNIDAFWFSADAAKLMDLKMEGFVRYPFENSWSLAEKITGETYAHGGFGTPEMGLTNGIRTVYQTRRWGDNFWVTEGGIYPLSLEDTRGWERVDFNARHKLSDDSLRRFRLFCADLYGTVDALNAAWGSSYSSFDEIEPEKDTTDDHGYRKYYDGKEFKEWSRAIADLDSFRTLERLYDYRGVMQCEWESFPLGKLNVRTEGGNWIAKIDPETVNPHYRHVFYSQRRCGAQADLMADSDLIYAHSDYTTLPYTPSEVSELTKAELSIGIRPVLLPQFDRMRDIAVNEIYGTDFTSDYNLSGSAVKGAYINTVCSLFEWFKATYEAGGAPGILWQDYLCDGYATSVQKKEIAFYAKKLKEAMSTPEAQEWAKQPIGKTVVEGAENRFTFEPDYVRSVVCRHTK